MKIAEVAELLSYEIATGEAGLENAVHGAYVGDLLSWVMGNLNSGNVWITVQGHKNIVGVASLNDASGLIIAEGAPVEPAMLKSAEAEGIAVLRTKKSAYDVAKDLIALGI